jgi:cell division protein FtsL
MKKRKYLKLRGEDTMVTIIVISIIGLLFTSFIGQAMLQSSNSELQRLKQKIETQEELNAGIQMKINELASLDNALEVADTFGLEYNNNNIRVITD